MNFLRVDFDFGDLATTETAELLGATLRADFSFPTVGPPGEVSASLPWENVTGRPSTFPPAAHTHTANQITDFAQAVGQVSPPASWDTLTNKPSTFAPSAHGHSIAEVTGLQAALDAKQASGSYAPLVNNLVPAANLPSYVDDVIEAANLAALPMTGETGKIYVTLDTNKVYRWSGSAYVEIVASPSSTDAVPEGSTNLYHTAARAAAAAPVQSVAGRTGAITLAVGDVANAVATSDARLSDSRSPLVHKASHATGGSDVLLPSDISAGWAQVLSNQTITGNTLLSAGRNRRITLIAANITANVDLPSTDNQAGDVITLFSSFFGTNALTIRRSGGTPPFVTLATLTATGRSLTFVSDGTATGWSLVPVDTHTHPDATSTVAGFLSTADKTKLDGIASGATANSSDATLLNRANHTGTQAHTTITGLGDAATKNTGTTAGTVAAGDDARLSDARTPLSHTHGNITNGGLVGTISGLPLVTTTAGAVTTLPLGSANQVFKVNSSGTAVEFGDGGGVDDYTVITSNQTATNGARIAANTTAGAFTLTLPATPDNGDTVSILDFAGTFNTNNLTISRNGSNIESLAENMDCNIRNAAFTLVFVGVTIGWKVVPYFGSSVNFSSPNAIGNSVPNTGAFTTLTATSLTSGTGAFNNLTATPSSGSALTLTGGTVTASAPVLDATQTWNNAAVTFTGLRFNLTPTASDPRSLIVSLEQSSTPFCGIQSIVGVPPTEAVRIFGGGRGFRFGARQTGVTGAIDFCAMRWQTNIFSILHGVEFGWSSQPYDISNDVALHRDAANTLAQRNGTSAQTFNIYNFFASSTNYERGFLKWSSNLFTIGTEKGSGGGSARGLELRTDNVARINISATGGIGFFGAAAAAQPTAVADATDAATSITQLNALLSRMRTLGLIAT